MSVSGYWWVALGLGLVVELVAVALLHAFFGQVRRIEAGSGAIWQAGKQVAGNTVTTWMLGQTAERLDLLAEEAGRHDALLRQAVPARGEG